MPKVPDLPWPTDVISAHRLTLLTGLLLAFCPALCSAQPSAIPRELHPWGRFEEGVWKRCRTVTETRDENGAVVSMSTTETKTTLVKIEPDGVTLKVEAAVEIAGRQLSAEPKTVKQGFHGEQATGKAAIKDLGSGQVTLDNGARVIPCRIEQVDLADEKNRTITKTYYSTTVAPYVLRRESVTTNLDGGEQVSETTLEVTSLRVPFLLRRVYPTALVQATVKHPKGKTETCAYTSTEVPGGIISQTAKEFDDQGHLIRCSTLELLEYGSESGKSQSVRVNRARGHHREHRSSAR